MDNERIIWDYLKSTGLNDFGAAGLMGNLYAESALNSKNLQSSYEKKLGMTDESYTQAVDDRTYTDFIRDSAGYGLAQWTYWTRKRSLLYYAQENKKSIGDLGMQLDFLYMELSENYKEVLSVLMNATSVLEASNIVLFKFERPANQDESVQQKRASYGQKYYDKFAQIVIEDVTDNIPDEWAKDAFNWAIERGILLGDGKDYKLHSNCTRQEMIVFLHRLYKAVQ